ncbi:MAG: hypothetical protein M1834_002093 [Cirrosporium novae-zelandiae]|nr:MAG: hypothetical protein M1834_002093 [Cirrosporium novae-zelandiae]
MAFCADCQNIGNDNFGADSNSTVTLKSTFEHLRLSAHSSHCDCCSFILSGLLQAAQNDRVEVKSLDKDKVEYYWRKMTPNVAKERNSQRTSHDEINLKHRYVTCLLVITGNTRAAFEAVVHDDDPAMNDDRIIGRPVAKRTGDEEALEHIKLWLHECCQHHIETCGKTELKKMPTRVLDLRPDSVVYPGSLRLLDDLQNRKEYYATLSYCWGKPSESNVFFTTTKETYASRREEIELKELPRALQDAVKVVRYLGIRYLWVDALCIIQHDIDDWGRESVQMSDIYENSLLTVASASSSSSNESFLEKDRGFSDQPRFHVPLKHGGSSLYLLSMTETQVLGLGPSLSDHWKQPLQARAWTLQERLLSHRTIFFDRLQLVWECPMGQALESRRLFISNYVGADFLAKFKGVRKLNEEDLMKSNKPMVSEFHIDDSIVSKPVDYAQWYKLLDNYISRQLTAIDDALPAISGLAVRWQRMTTDIYLGGIWKGDILSGLLWSCYPNPDHLPRRSIFAPSWSWANSDKLGTVFCACNVEDSELQVHTKTALLLDHQTIPRFNNANNFFGQLQSATLTFQGWLTKVWASPKHDPHAPYPLLAWKMDHQLKFKASIDNIDDLVDRLYSHGEGARESFYVFMLGIWREKTTFQPRTDIWGLVLKETGETQGPTNLKVYNRKGCIAINLLPYGGCGIESLDLIDFWGDWWEATIMLA